MFLENLYCDSSRPWEQVLWLKLPVWKVGDRRFEPLSGVKFQKNTMFLPGSLERFNILEIPVDER